MALAFLLVSCVVVGVCIGAVGVGGVLLIPALMGLAGLGVHEAAATALFTFLFTGILGTSLFMRRGTIAWAAAIPVCLGALPSSYAGAALGASIPAGTLTWIVAAIILGAGVNILLPRPSAVAPGRRTAHASAILFIVGAASGFGAGISGAGGPLFSVPLMLGLHFAPLVAVGTGQVVQIAAAASGSLGNAAHGSIQYALALPVTIVELVGVAAGVRLAHAVPAPYLRAGAALLCIASAIGMIVRAS